MRTNSSGGFIMKYKLDEKLVLDESDLVDGEIPAEPELPVENNPIEPLVDADVVNNALLDTINREIADEWARIDSLNSVKLTLEGENANIPGAAEIIDNIITDKTVSIGMLQKIVELIDGGKKELVELGKDKAEDIIAPTEEPAVPEVADAEKAPIEDESLTKKPLKEGRWDFTVGEESKKLRQLITDNDGDLYGELKAQIIAVCEKCKGFFNEDDYEIDELNDIIEDAEMLEESQEEFGKLQDEGVYDDDESLDERFDYVLGELYDFCDGNNIWLDL